MKRNKLFFVLLSLLFICNPLQAQLKDAIFNMLSSDTATANQPPIAADSNKVAMMEKALEEARMNEMNLRMEMEQIRMNSYASDSLKKEKQRLRIDSLRKITTKIPVVVEDDTLYYIYAKHGGYSPRDRAKTTSDAITELGKSYLLKPDSIHWESTDIITDLIYKKKVIASFTDQDGLWENSTRDELAAKVRLIIVDKLKELQETHGLLQLGKRIFLFILVLVIQGFLYWGTTLLYRRLRVRIEKLKDTKLKPVAFRDYELFDTQKQVGILIFFSKIARYALVFVQLLITVPMLFGIFPQTEDLALQIFSYLWNPVKNMGISIFKYMPDLFTILVTWYVIRYVVKGIKYLAGEIASGNLKINGFYPDWAQPTFQIIRFLMYAFMIAIIYPLLPGAKEDSFKGISVFVGIIFSLGSGSVIGNIMAGMVMTYMRPFKIGDRIKLNETTGNVIEKTPFVTRLKTPKNEIVTIPNSFVMSSHTTNYSSSARNYGLIIHSEVTYGFDIDWRVVHELLIKAALKTPGVMPEPTPFVLETSIQDFYPVYQINAYIKDADQLAKIYSELHQNVQDLSNEAGIELLSPHYYAARDGSETTIPKEYQKKKQEK